MKTDYWNIKVCDQKTTLKINSTKQLIMKSKAAKTGLAITLMIFSLITKAQNMENQIKSKQDVFAEVSRLTQQLSPAELNNLMNSEQEFFLIDVRTEKEHDAGYISGSMWLPRGFLEVRIQEVCPDPDALIVVYCSLGGISLLAVKTLQELGYRNVYSIKGGMKAWVGEAYSLYNLLGEFKVVNLMKKDPNLSTYDMFQA